MENKQILLLRKKIFEMLKMYEGNAVLLDYPQDILKQLFFSYDENKDAYRFIDEYFVNQDVRELMKKIDFSNVSFDRFRFIKTLGMDFTGFTGIKINPQTIYDKDLSKAILNGVEFIGPFDGCAIDNCNFTGSVGAVINPQTVLNKNLSNCILAGTTIEGEFDGVALGGTNFEGTKGLISINPQLVANKNLNNTTLTGVVFTGPFDEVSIGGASFIGSKEAYINLKTVNSHDLSKTLLCDANVIDVNPKAIVGYYTYYGAKFLEEKTVKKI